MQTVTNVLIFQADNYDEWRAVADVSRWRPDGPLSDDPRHTAIRSVLEGDEVSHRRIVGVLEYLAELREHYIDQIVEAGQIADAEPPAGVALLTGCQTVAEVIIAASRDAIGDIDRAVEVFEAARELATEHSGFVPVGPRLMARSCRTDETRESASWIEDWSWQLQNAIADHDAWGLFGVAPDGDVRLFDVSPAGVVDCSRWAVEARVLLPVRMAPTSALVRAVLRWVDDDGDHADDLLVEAVVAWQRGVSVTDRRHLEVPT